MDIGHRAHCAHACWFKTPLKNLKSKDHHHDLGIVSRFFQGWNAYLISETKNTKLDVFLL